MSAKPNEAVDMTKVPDIAITLNENNEAGSATSFNDTVEYLESPIKSDSDDGEYRTLKLPNDLTILLMSRPRHKNADDCKAGKCNRTRGANKKTTSPSETSAKNTDCGTCDIVQCTLSIDVGWLSDSAENPCIAELLGGVFLTASKKYPTPHSFKKFLQMQDCGLRVCCQSERTMFSFQTQEIHLHEALDRFVNCFIEPLLKREVVQNEKDSGTVVNKAFVPSEVADPSNLHAKNYLFGILASKCDDNPASHLVPGRFKVASSRSVDALLREIEKFMKRHYSAHRMVAVLEAHWSLDESEEYAKTYFSRIPSNGLPPIDFTRFTFDKCFDSPEFRMIYEIQTSNEMLDHRLELHWSMPSPVRFYRSKPTYYLESILEQGGKGSLIWYLRKKNWCINLRCTTGRTFLEPNSIFSILSLDITVTDEGQRNYKNILDAVYSYINLLRSEGPQRRTYEVIREKFDSLFQRHEPEIRKMCFWGIASKMQSYASADYLNGCLVLPEYDPAAIQQCLDQMLPEKTNIIVCQKKFGKRHFLTKKWEEVHDRVEDVTYRKSTIPEAWINRWKNMEPLPELKVPVVDDTTTLEPEDSCRYPVKIHSDELCEIYHLDTEFRDLSNAVNYFFCTPVPRESAENAFMLDALACLLRIKTAEELTKVTYSNSEVSVFPDCSDPSGLLVWVRGDHNNTLRLTEIIAKRAATLANDVTERVFADVKAAITALYRDRFCSSDALASDVFGRTAGRIQWLFIEKYNASCGVYLRKFKDFARYFFDRVFVKCLAEGDFTRSEVIESVRRCVRALKCRPLPPNSFPQTSDYKIPPGAHCYRFQSTDIDDVTTIKNYYQFSERSIEQNAILFFLQVTFAAPELKFLRARQKLDDYEMKLGHDARYYGYSLATKKTQSDTITRVATIEATIEEFREAMHKWFGGLTTTEWEKLKAACKRTANLKRFTFNEALSADWHEIASGEYILNRTARYLKVLNELPIEDLRRSMMHLTSMNSKIRKLSVQAVSRKEYAAGSADASQEQSSPLRLNFFTNLPGEEARSDDYYITNVAEDTRPQRCVSKRTRRLIRS